MEVSHPFEHIACASLNPVEDKDSGDEDVLYASLNTSHERANSSSLAMSAMFAVMKMFCTR